MAARRWPRQALSVMQQPEYPANMSRGATFLMIGALAAVDCALVCINAHTGIQLNTRRAMAEASQRYSSTEEMLADVAKLAAADDPFSVRPADLPSMGGAAIADRTPPQWFRPL